MTRIKSATERKYTHEELMMEAIVESRQSIPEHQDRMDPMVGAIIATSDGIILGRAHRGELRIGEHCEFTLIERKLRDRNLDGCILYVTLEPCTDESRKDPKRGCSTHVAKARIAEVFVGIEDPNPKIATQGIKFLETKGIKVTMFPDHLEEVIRLDNSQFIKEKEKEALQAKRIAYVPEKSLLVRKAPGTTIKSFNPTTIQKFINASEASFRYPSEQFTQWAEEFQLIERDNNEVTPTGLGILLFGANPQQSFPQAVFKVEVDYGEGGGNKRFYRAISGSITRYLNIRSRKSIKAYPR